MPQEGIDLAGGQRSELHRILLQEFLPMCVLILVHERGVEVDPDGAAVAARKEQAEAVDRAEKHPVKPGKGVDVGRLGFRHLTQEGRAGALPDLGRRLFGVGHDSRLCQHLRARLGQDHGRQPV